LYKNVYNFARRSDEWTKTDVPLNVVVEMLCGVVLAPYWALDMAVPHLPFIGATDASTEFGFGACIAPMGLEQIRSVARLDAKIGDHVQLACGGVDQDAQSRLGRPHDLGLAFSDFSVILCLKVQDDEHINIREGRAFLAYLRWVLRTPHRHGRRVVVLIDSKVWIGAAAKGRSASWKLNRLLRQVAALVMAAGLRLHLVFVPSKHNPSDAASRGRRPCAMRREKRDRPIPRRTQKLTEWVSKQRELDKW
jgi:hypothetical protein